jgi:steroid delta-isomerase-like uncharacterized protein
VLTRILSNLRLRVLVLIALAMLPSLGLLLVSVRDQRDQAIESGTLEARRLASLAAADQGRQIESTQQLLTVLARLPEIRSADESCDSLLADLLTQFPRYLNIGVIAADGMLSCSGLPAQGDIYLGDRAYFQQAMSMKDFAVGEYQIGRISGEPALNCGFPILDSGGNVLGVVYAAIDLNSLAQFAAQAKLPLGSVLTIYDRSGRVMVRLPEQADVVGVSMVGSPVVDTILSEGTGVTEKEDDGETFVVAFESLRSAQPSAAFVSIALPKAEIVAPAEDAFGNHLTRLAIAVLVVMIAAWVGTDLLIRQNTDTNKVLVRRLYDGFSTGGVDLLDEVVAEGFIDHDPMPDQPAGLVGLKQAVGSFRSAFPDGEMVIEDLVAEGNKVVARVSMSGTHRGEYAGLPGTGRLIRSEGVEIFRIDGGKIVEGWSRFVLPLAMIESREDGDAIRDLDAMVELISERRPGPAKTVLRRMGRLFRFGRG